jgi:hypothetical protein
MTKSVFYFDAIRYPVVMTSRLERKWWFAAPACALAAIVTAYLMESAGIPRPVNFAQWTLYLMCFAGLQRGFSFAGWLLVLCLSPANKALERTR